MTEIKPEPELKITPKQPQNSGGNTFNELENYDLFLEFLKVPKVAAYLNAHYSMCNNPYDKVLDASNAEEDYTGIHKEILPIINKLFSRFKIGMKILEKDVSFDLTSYRVDVTKISSDGDLDEVLPLLFLEFWIYPSSLFTSYNIIKQFQLGSLLQFTTPTYSQPRQACPEWSKSYSMLYTYKPEDSLTYVQEVFHHELFHYFDFIYSGCYYRVEKGVSSSWSALNKDGFNYGSGGHNERVYQTQAAA